MLFIRTHVRRSMRPGNDKNNRLSASRLRPTAPGGGGLRINCRLRRFLSVNKQELSLPSVSFEQRSKFLFSKFSFSTTLSVSPRNTPVNSRLFYTPSARCFSTFLQGKALKLTVCREVARKRAFWKTNEKTHGCRVALGGFDHVDVAEIFGLP